MTLEKSLEDIPHEAYAIAEDGGIPDSSEIEKETKTVAAPGQHIDTERDDR